MKANPVVNRINSISRGTTKMIFQLKETPLIIANPKTTIREIIRLIKAFITTEKIITGFEKLTFLNKSTLLTMDNIPTFVASPKKFHTVIPSKSATAK